MKTGFISFQIFKYFKFTVSGSLGGDFNELMRGGLERRDIGLVFFNSFFNMRVFENKMMSFELWYCIKHFIMDHVLLFIVCACV